MDKIFLAFALGVAFLSPTNLFAEGSESVTPDRSEASEIATQKIKLFFTKILQPAQPEPVKVAFNYSWLDSQPEAKGDEQWRCLSEALYFEARGETVKGQFAVAEIIQNRVNSARFPSSFCGVIKQGTGRKYQCQFTYTCDGNKEVIAEKQAYERVSKVARAVIDGIATPLTSGATHYHTKSVRPSWAKVYTETARIGVHIFYRHNYRTASN
jgi:spore germination cell wall hydrolase CwlJ-like protein